MAINKVYHNELWMNRENSLSAPEYSQGLSPNFALPERTFMAFIHGTIFEVQPRRWQGICGFDRTAAETELLSSELVYEVISIASIAKGMVDLPEG